MSQTQQQVQLRIEGLHCGGCASSARAALSALPGVSSAQVSLEDGSANVSYDPAQASTQQMIDAVNQLGYRASLAA
jgi:copper chaperone